MHGVAKSTLGALPLPRVRGELSQASAQLKRPGAIPASSSFFSSWMAGHPNEDALRAFARP
jgi:hypothetical protein